MTRHKDEWEDQLKHTPFSRGLFTARHIEQVQRKLREQGELSSIRRRKAFLVAIPVLTITAVLMLAIQPSWPQTLANQIDSWFQPQSEIAPKPHSEPRILDSEKESDPQPEIVQDKIKVKGYTYALASPSYWTAEAPVFEVRPDQAYPTLESTAQFVRIQDGEQTGWVGAWYIETDEKPADIIQQAIWHEVVVVQPTMFYAYPNTDAPTGYELPSGKIVRILAEYEDWVNVDFMLYAEPMSGDKWIPKHALSSEFDRQLAKEGFVRFAGIGSYIYSDEAGMQPKEHITTLVAVFIEEETDATYRISAPGGRSGYIRKTDFIPNPFSLGSGTYLEISDASMEAFIQFQKNRDDEALRGLEPFEVFKLYHRANLMREADLVYSLLNHDPEYEIPNRETFMEEYDFSNHDLDQLRVFATTRVKTQYANEEEAYIVPEHAEEQDWFFRLTKNDQGIWKVSWLAMQ